MSSIYLIYWVYSSTGLQKKPDPARSSIDAVTSSDSSSPDLSRPGRGGRVERLSNHTDVLSTVLEMLAYEIQNGEYPGYSLLREPPTSAPSSSAAGSRTSAVRASRGPRSTSTTTATGLTSSSTSPETPQNERTWQTSVPKR
jgi:hypothetical protein